MIDKKGGLLWIKLKGSQFYVERDGFVVDIPNQYNGIGYCQGKLYLSLWDGSSHLYLEGDSIIKFPLCDQCLEISWRSNDYESDEDYQIIYKKDPPGPFSYEYWYAKAKDIKTLLNPEKELEYEVEYEKACQKHKESEAMWAKMR